MMPSRHPSKFMKFHKFSKFINFFDFFTFYKTMKSGFSCPKIHPKTLGKLLKTCTMYRGKSEDTITYLQNDFRTSRSNSKLKRQKCRNWHSGDILKSATVRQKEMILKQNKVCIFSSNTLSKTFQFKDSL